MGLQDQSDLQLEKQSIQNGIELSFPQDKGTQLLYSSCTPGSRYFQSDGGANYLCLPDNPEHLVQLPIGSMNGLHDHNAPCVICYASKRVLLLMILAKLNCTAYWTMEYQGYLMFDYHCHKQNSMFECVDKNAQAIPGGAKDSRCTLFYPVETKCIGLLCPPYNEKKELPCVE